MNWCLNSSFLFYPKNQNLIEKVFIPHHSCFPLYSLYLCESQEDLNLVTTQGLQILQTNNKVNIMIIR